MQLWDGEEYFMVYLEATINEKASTSYYYPRKLAKFLDWIPDKDKDKPDTYKERQKWFVNKGRGNDNWLHNCLAAYALHVKDTDKKGKSSNGGKRSGGTQRNYFKPIWKLLKNNRIAYSRDFVTSILTKEKNHADDRAPSLAEIEKLIQNGDMRVKVAVLIMCSSGIRLNSWDRMKWGDIKPIEQQREVVAASLHVYDDKMDEEYDTFITPEAYFVAKQYMDYRAYHGENITDDSWVLRNRFDPNSKGLVTKPERLAPKALSNLLNRLMHKLGIRGTLPPGKSRHEFQVDHGFPGVVGLHHSITNPLELR